MRGKPAQKRAGGGFPGLIPAHAGKTYPRPLRACEPGAHPRSCGENVSIAQRVGMCAGSSPLMRGKLGKSTPRDPISGLIPAHAGKTCGAAAHGPRVKAHPRSCGENPCIRRHPRSALGSSPLMRGKRIRVSPFRFGRRLIPAHAGKTGARVWGSPRQRAHPRSCGENQSG
mgnify:CR=1 FL=1